MSHLGSGSDRKLTKSFCISHLSSIFQSRVHISWEEGSKIQGMLNNRSNSFF